MKSLNDSSKLVASMILMEDKLTEQSLGQVLGVKSDRFIKLVTCSTVDVY